MGNHSQEHHVFDGDLNDALGLGGGWPSLKNEGKAPKQKIAQVTLGFFLAL